MNVKKVRKEGLERYSENPILLPNQDAWWESKAVFNPAVLYDGKKIHMLYRAVGEYVRYVSRVGYTFSEDGFNFKRTKSVVLGPNEGYEKYGTEDPRLIEIDNRVYVSYVIVSDYVTSGPINSSTALATTDDYYHHTRLGIITGRAYMTTRM